MICKHSHTCSACPWIDFSPDIQKNKKLNQFQDAISKHQIQNEIPIQFHQPAAEAFRDRLDFVIEEGRLGLYSKVENKIIDIDHCPLLTPELQTYYTEFRKIPWSIRKGSFRLRVSQNDPQIRGAWLDFSNQDIKTLLDEKSCLQQLLDLSTVVEIGQKRKVLLPTMKLGPPELHEWTRTWVEGKAFPLLSHVGSFSQAGDIPNQVLTRIVEDFVNKIHPRQILEFGAGTGNLSFPSVGRNKDRHLTALEFDHLACKGLQALAEKNHISLEVREGDFQNQNLHDFGSFDCILVNPPRSGLMKFLDHFKSPENRPQYFIYMSCYLESFCADVQKLQGYGYCPQAYHIADQFPHSPHFEVISLFIRS